MTNIVFSEKDYTLGSGVLRVCSGGSGRALIHLHSAAGPRISRVVEALADHHRVHAPFVPGFENTVRHASVKTMQDIADLVAEFVRRECDGVCDVVGESFGGWIALWLAIRHPDIVGQLVLEAPAGLRRDGQGGLPADPQERLRALNAYPDRAPAEKRSESLLLGNRKAVVEYTGGVAFDEALAAHLPDIKSRTLVLLGTLDKVIPADTGRLLKAKLQQSHLTYIWDAAHAIEFDQPTRVSTLMLDFLDRGESFLVRQAAKGAA